MLLRDTPWPRQDVPLCLSRAVRSGGIEECSLSRSAALDERAYGAQRAAAAGRKNVLFWDLTSHLCDHDRCAAVIDDVVVYRDDSHISTRYARKLAPAVSARLAPFIAPGRP